MIHPNALEIEVGTVFGRWTVLAPAKRDKHGRKRFLCRCDCGVEKLVAGTYLRHGKSQSCGCLQRERAPGAPIKHGMAGTPEYRAWQQMRQRCSNRRHVEWRNYGGRGICVCKEWDQSFQAFYEHVGPRPSSQHSLDRIDNDGNYEPGNVRWATASEQRRNQRYMPTQREGRELVQDAQTQPGAWYWRGKWRPG